MRRWIGMLIPQPNEIANHSVVDVDIKNQVVYEIKFILDKNDGKL